MNEWARLFNKYIYSDQMLSDFENQHLKSKLKAGLEYFL